MPNTADRAKLVAANCIVLLVAGVAFCFWTLYYTDWFPVIGGILGLTGAFAWVGVFSNLIKDDRKDALQNWFDQHVLQTWTPFFIVVVALIAFFFGVVARTGAVVVDAGGDDIARNISILSVPESGPSESGEPAAELSSSPGTDASTLLPTGLFASRPYDVIAEGLPRIRVTVHAFERRRVKLPNDPMTAPVLLLRPNPGLSGMTVAENFKLEIKVDGQPFGHIDDYNGTSVWIGATRDVAIPRETQDRWRTENPETANAIPDVVFARWRTQAAVPGAFPLKAGMHVRAAVISAHDGRTIAVACRTVTVPTDRRDFPEELVIHDTIDQCK